MLQLCMLVRIEASMLPFTVYSYWILGDSSGTLLKGFRSGRSICRVMGPRVHANRLCLKLSVSIQQVL